MIWPPGQSVSFVKSSWFVDDREIELEEEEGPASLTVREFLFCVKVRKVVVVCPDFEELGVSFKIVVEGFQGTNDGKKFFIMNIIVLFGG